jgi:hypothetical protein
LSDKTFTYPPDPAVFNLGGTDAINNRRCFTGRCFTGF